MNLYLQGKVFIVTGGASGIGESIVRKLADNGAIACIVDGSEKASMRLCDELCTGGKQAYFVPTELSRTEACAYAVSQVMAEYGQIDGLVNNAGLNDGVSLENGNYEKFIGSLHRNVVHYYNMGNFSLPYLKKSRGVIVNICSRVAETGQGGASGYAAANGVRFGLTSQWACELLSFGIRVNAVVHGAFPFVAKVWIRQRRVFTCRWRICSFGQIGNVLAVRTGIFFSKLNSTRL